MAKIIYLKNIVKVSAEFVLNLLWKMLKFLNQEKIKEKNKLKIKNKRMLLKINWEEAQDKEKNEENYYYKIIITEKKKMGLYKN